MAATRDDVLEYAFDKLGEERIRAFELRFDGYEPAGLRWKYHVTTMDCDSGELVQETHPSGHSPLPSDLRLRVFVAPMGDRIYACFGDSSGAHVMRLACDVSWPDPVVAVELRSDAIIMSTSPQYVFAIHLGSVAHMEDELIWYGEKRPQFSAGGPWRALIVFEAWIFRE